MSLRAFDLNPPPGMTLIPAGVFMMGNATNEFSASEGAEVEVPQHMVYVSEFYMDIHEVTKAMWDEVKSHTAGNGYSYWRDGFGKAPNHPVHSLTWYDAVTWCNARSERDGLRPVYYVDAGFATVYKSGDMVPFVDWSADGYRLPTEAEWEKAARGGAVDKRFPWTDCTNNISWMKANYFGRSNSYE
jgi:formylglycine-generating enzyme required for sulfatase activity